MATHSSTLAWIILWMEKPVGYSLWGRKEFDMTEKLHFSHFGIPQKKIITGFGKLRDLRKFIISELTFLIRHKAL